MVYSRQRGESREQQRPRSSEFELRPRSPEHSPPPQWDSSGDWEVQRRPQPDRRERRDGRDDREFEGRGHRSSGEGRSRGDRGDRDRQRSRHEGRSRSIRRHGRDGRPWHEKDDHRKSEGGRHGRRRRRSKSATRREAGKRPHSTRGQEGTEGPWRERRSPGRRRSRSQSRGRAARSSHAADPNVLRETMEVQASLSGRIIGRGGVCIMQVEKDSGAKVDVEKGAGAIHFSGSPEAIERAKEMVQNLIDEISAPKSAAAGDEEVEENVSQTIDLQPHEVGRIIGKKGETIMKLQTDTGTKIDVSKNEPYTVTVRGPCESVLKAIDLISELVEEANRTHTAAGDSVAEETTEQTMEVPKAMVGRIIGKGGQTITDMEKESGARIKVNSTDNSATVTIRGTHDQVVCAMDSITACIEDKADASTGPDAVEDVIELPVQDYGRVIGTAGGRINDVRDRTRATIQVSKDEDHCRVRLKGSEEQVQRAKDLVLQLVADGSVAPDSGADHKNLDTLGLPAPRVGRIIPGPRVDVAKHGPPRVVAENVAQAKNMIAALLEASGKTAPGSSDDQSNDAGFGDENTSSGNPRPGADLLLNALKMHQSQKLQIRSKASAPAPPGSASAGSSPEDSEDCNPTDEPAKPLQVQEEPKKPAPARSRRGPPPKPSQAPELAAKDQ
eukprot:TRINITY_DN3066_c0_g1_i1.p1 TRINITY_DN3066_c0_g1~~TRINITY_DN3066_c0_g1_i1.p1  ORF type:complete len:671 (-),score=114.79 TRINITY_DN3066_c0_g1_i1:42-2054(-)